MDLFNCNEVEKLLHEIECLKLENKKLNNEISELKKELENKSRKKFNTYERELLKMYSLQKKADGSYPTIRELAKMFNCSVGLVYNITKGIKKGSK